MTASAITVGRGPIGDLAVDAGIVVVTNPGDASVSIIDTATSTVSAHVGVAGEPVGVALREDRAYVGLSSAGVDSLAVIDTGTADLVATHPLAYTVTSVAVHPDGKLVFVGRCGRDGADIAVIDTVADEITAVPVLSESAGVVGAVRVSVDGTRVYAAVSDATDGTLVVVDSHTTGPIGGVRIGYPIRDVAVTPDDTGVFVLAWHPHCGGVMHFVETGSDTITTTMALGANPTQFALSRDGGLAYIVDGDFIAVLETNTSELVGTVAPGTSPSCVGLSSDSGLLYVADHAGSISELAIPV